MGTFKGKQKRKTLLLCPSHLTPNTCDIWYVNFSEDFFFITFSVSAEAGNFCSKRKQMIFISIQENLKKSMWNWTRTQVLSLLAFYDLLCIYVLLNENEKINQPSSACPWLPSRETGNSKSQPEPDLPGS